MAKNGVARMAESQKLTSKRKADVVLEIIRGQDTIVDFGRANDLKQTDGEKWTEEFVSGGNQALKADPRVFGLSIERKPIASNRLSEGKPLKFMC